MIKRLHIFKNFFSLILFLICVSLKAQTMYVSTSDGTITQGRIHRVDLSNCTSVQVVPAGITPVLFDIALSSTNANIIYGVDQSNNLYQIDISVPSAFILNSSFNFNFGGGHLLNALVCDQNGMLYAADGQGSGIYKYDVGAAQWSFIGTPGGYVSGGDLTFFNGKCYLTTSSNQLLNIVLSPFSFAIESTLNVGNVFGAVTVSTGTICSPNQTLIGSSFQTLYTIDPLNGNCTPKCNNIIPFSETLYGSATLAESFAPPVLNVTASSSAPSVCNGSSATLTSGGVVAYTWQPGNITGISVSVTPSSPTTYTVTGADGNGCTATATVSVGVNALPSATASSTNVSCYGINNATASAAATGGSGTYTYNWSNSQSGPSLSGLPNGGYTVTVVDGNNCTSTATVNITQPSAALSVSTNPVQHVNCFSASTGSALANGSGGTSIYTYSWSNGETTASISNVPANTYTVTITDANLCTSTNSVILTQPATALTASTAATQTACQAGTGTVTATGNGGTSAYSYSWSNSQTNQTASGLTAGSYSVVITDANGCTTTAADNVTVAGSPATTANTLTDVSCYGGSNGSANSSATGGTGSLSYSWTNGATTQNISGLAVGNYTVVVNDINGCTSTASVIITQPVFSGDLSASSVQNILCFGNNNGSTVVSGTGGTGSLSYSWNTGATTASVSGLAPGTYTATVADANGCSKTVSLIITQPGSALSALTGSVVGVKCFGNNTGSAAVIASGGTTGYSYSWSNTQTGSSVSDLVAGIYTVIVTDNNGCTSTATANITQPSVALSATTNTDQNVQCFGNNNGVASASGAGGTPIYFYSWSGGQTTQSITGLTPATYTVVVTDNNSCTYSSTVFITQPSAGLSSTVTSVDPTCNGATTGSATGSASGGTTNYSYSWMPGNATTSAISNIGAGTYTLQVTDANGCTTSNTVTLTQPSLMTTSVSSGSTVCAGNTTVVSASASGGTGNYTYSWSNGLGTGTGPYSVNPSVSTTYSVTISDGCTTSIGNTVAVSVNPLPVADFSDTLISIDDVLYTFTDLSTGAASWYWNFGDGSSSNTQNPTHQFDGTVNCNVTLIVTSLEGCMDTMIKTIEIPEILHVPNVFTPNGDNMNENFHTYSIGMKKYHLEIYDRWGLRMFTSDSPKINWDGTTTSGKDAPDGTYYYILDATGVSGKVYKQAGFLQLLR